MKLSIEGLDAGFVVLEMVPSHPSGFNPANPPYRAAHSTIEEALNDVRLKLCPPGRNPAQNNIAAANSTSLTSVRQ